MSELFRDVLGLLKGGKRREKVSSPLEAEPVIDNSSSVPTVSTMARPLTMDELLDRTLSPSHPSQGQFAPLNDGRMLRTCEQNGYSFRGYDTNLGRNPPRPYRLRAVARMQSITLPPKK